MNEPALILSRAATNPLKLKTLAHLLSFHARHQHSFSTRCRSARRALLRTPAGKRLAGRKLQALNEKLTLEQRRRLGFEENGHWYKRTAAGNVGIKDRDCLDDESAVTKRQYSGTHAYCEADGITWKEYSELSSVASDFTNRQIGTNSFIQKVCKNIRNKDRSGDFDAALIGDHKGPRVPCVGDSWPWCLKVQDGVVQVVWASVAGGMRRCGEYYLDLVKQVAGVDGMGVTPVEDNWKWHLERVTSSDGVYDDDPKAMLYDGSGTVVYVMDSGINKNHNEFGTRIGTGYNAIYSATRGECETDDATYKCADTDGHGTHTASVVAGATVGIAPGAKIHPVKIMDSNGARTNDLTAASNWIISHHTNEYGAGTPAVVVAAISSVITADYDANQAMTSLVEAGFVTVLSAGNNDDDALSYSPGSISTTTDAITVGAANVDDSKVLRLRVERAA